jgi:hypothetical protein
VTSVLRTGVVRTGCCGKERRVDELAFLLDVLVVRRVGASTVRTAGLVRLPAELALLPVDDPVLADASRRVGLLTCPAVYTRRVRDAALYGVLGGEYLSLLFA